MNENAPPTIRKYKILEELGKGAFGVSYLAEHELLDKKVVIKLAQLENPEFVRRLENEAKALLKLTHPNIAQIYETGTTEEGQFYVALEFVSGEILGSIIQENGPLEYEDILDVSRQLAWAISYAHSQGFIYRDIKPNNIIVAPNGAVKIVDFGLAGKLEVQTEQTIGGEIFGTPVYMSPEQIRGEPQSSASDVYNLGIVIYEMAYGKPPFKGGNIVSLFKEILQKDIKFPSTPAVADRLINLIQQCTHHYTHLWDLNSEAYGDKFETR